MRSLSIDHSTLSPSRTRYIHCITETIENQNCSRVCRRLNNLIDLEVNVAEAQRKRESCTRTAAENGRVRWGAEVLFQPPKQYSLDK